MSVVVFKSQMQTINYTRFIREKASYWKKNLRSIRGQSPPPPRPPRIRDWGVILLYYATIPAAIIGIAERWLCHPEIATAILVANLLNVGLVRRVC